ncbi:MAG: TonB-dependent receptor plug domain-containing protein, partial [Burkholderiales bacterium]|nr:TonB-dependent receptor plug domain-containing protein [Burkholderiales bacterium]
MTFLLVCSWNANAQETLKTPPARVTGILPDRLESVPGSFDIVDRKDLESREPVSIKEALDGVAGINIVDEDSMGLGLNIGVRGLDPRRTSRTLLLEDGMPLFLGPYGDPSAHYSTPLDRVQRIEVVKGSGQILYGPQTVGGMINFVTRPVPRDGVRGSLSGAVGNQGFRSAYANVGYGNERAGFMIDALQKKGDGVRDNHDFDVRDLALKARFTLTDTQELLGKISRYEEDSHISETGLGAVEYAENKYQAPTGRQDRFLHERTAVQLQHIWRPNDGTKLATQLYHVASERSSFRQINEPGGNNGRSELERCPGGVDNANLSNGVLCGGRWRPREFQYTGFEPRLDFQHGLFGLRNDAVVGFRYHVEEQTREQYRGDTAAFQDEGFAKSNVLPRERILIDVQAMSYYAQNTFHVGDWSISPGVRIEDLRTDTTVYRADGNAGYAHLKNDRTVVLPGLGVAWNGIDSTT